MDRGGPAVGSLVLNLDLLPLGGGVVVIPVELVSAEAVGPGLGGV